MEEATCQWRAAVFSLSLTTPVSFSSMSEEKLGRVSCREDLSADHYKAICYNYTHSCDVVYRRKKNATEKKETLTMEIKNASTRSMFTCKMNSLTSLFLSFFRCCVCLHFYCISPLHFSLLHLHLPAQLFRAHFFRVSLFILLGSARPGSHALGKVSCSKKVRRENSYSAKKLANFKD